MPEIRTIVKKYWAAATLAEMQKLLRSPWHEERMVALLILVEKFRRADASERARIYNLYLKNIKTGINNWDLVDVTAHRIVGAYLSDKNRAPLYKLARSRNLWERRVAILSTFWFLRSGNSALTIKIAEILLSDKHDLIHKAVGWMLREVGKRCSVGELEIFLDAHAPVMPRTMLRYSIEKLSVERRRFWMAK